MIPSICTFVIKLTHSHIIVAMLMLQCVKCIIQYKGGGVKTYQVKKKNQEAKPTFREEVLSCLNTKHAPFYYLPLLKNIFI